MAFANFLRSLFKQDAVTTRDGCAGQVSVFIVPATKQAEEFSFFLLLIITAGTGSGRSGRISESGSFLQSALNPRTQLSDSTLQTINGRGIEFLGLVVLRSDIVHFRGN